MRHVLRSAVVLAAFSLSCGAGAQSGSLKLGEALAFTAVAAAAQVAQLAAEQRARNSAPVAMSSTGVSVSPTCDNDGQYGCVSVSAATSRADAPEPELDDNGARDYVLGYVNGVRKLNGVPPVVRDDALDAFARAGSDELAQDHAPNQHMLDHGRELVAASAEVQSSPDGAAPGPLQDQIAQSLLRFTGEGPGGAHHDTLLRAEWRKLGVGIVSRNGRAYLTVDFAGGRPDISL